LAKNAIRHSYINIGSGLKNKKTIMIKIAIALGVLVTATLLMKKTGMSYRQSVLKTMYPAIMWTSKAAGKKQIQANKDNAVPLVSFYSLHVKDINGNDFKFEDLKGKKVLIVNTASNCGFTAQYEALEKLSIQYRDKLVILGFPSNDFKEQEAGDNQNIVNFCKKNYGVSFPLMEKSSVIKGHDQNEVHKWLSDMTINGWCHQEPAWNFCKYLVNENGVLTHYFPMIVDPLAPEVVAAIDAK
jgi:glutathione peroxidase